MPRRLSRPSKKSSRPKRVLTRRGSNSRKQKSRTRSQGGRSYRSNDGAGPSSNLTREEVPPTAARTMYVGVSRRRRLIVTADAPVGTEDAMERLRTQQELVRGIVDKIQYAMYLGENVKWTGNDLHCKVILLILDKDLLETILARTSAMAEKLVIYILNQEDENTLVISKDAPESHTVARTTRKGVEVPYQLQTTPDQLDALLRDH